MELYEAYSKEINDRSKLGLGPKPIDQGDLIIEIIDILLGPKSPSRNDALKHFTYNTLPGTTGAATVKACLLYTSPSPRDRQKSRMPSSA